MEFQHLRGFQGLNYSLKFAESLTLDKLKTWYYGIIRERKREIEKRKRNKRGSPFPLTPNPLPKERVKRKERERKREYPQLGKMRGVCRLCGGNRGRTLCKCLFII